MPRQAPAHYLRPNEIEWTPPTVVTFDTETRTLPNTEPQVLALRLWVARCIDRRPPRKGKERTLNGRGHTAAEFAQWLNDACIGRDTVWVYAHNLSFDLTTTRLPLHMVDLGWELDAVAIAGNSPWIRMSKGRKHLTVCDSGGWLPMPLAEIGKALGMSKPDLPDDDDTDGAWFARCQADVDILDAAMDALMSWWEAHRLGRWNITGASSGWNAMRHKMPPKSMVIDPVPDLCEWERRAVYGGRRQVNRVGEFRAGPFAEVDFEAAYPTVAASMPLPSRRLAKFDSLHLDTGRLDSRLVGIVAEVEVETDRPRWPLRTKGATFYPTGRFRTVLAGPDIAEARRLGCLRAIGHGWTYSLGGALAPWAQWVLACQRGEVTGVPPVAKLLCKQWGRMVIGKMAARSPVATKLGPSPYPDWHTEDGWDVTANAPGLTVDLAGQRWWVAKSGTPDNSFPAVLAWVEAYVRVALGRAIDSLGDAAVLQCDTDGMLVDPRHLEIDDLGDRPIMARHVSSRHLLQRAIDRANEQTAPLALRIKKEHSAVTVLGPQHLVLSGDRQFAGLSKSAEQTSPGVFRVRLWPKLAWQMGNGDRRGFTRPLVTPTVRGPFPTGWLHVDGRVTPVAATIAGDGQSIVDLEALPGDDGHGPMLAEVQHPRLVAMLAEATRRAIAG